MDLTYTQDPQNKYNLRMRTDRGGWGRGGGGDTLIHNAEYACILQSSDTMEVLCAAIKAVMQARNHVKRGKKFFTILLGYQEGLLWQLCALHCLLLLSTSVLSFSALWTAW